MKPQLSQDYNVDNRYRGMEQAQDNTRAKQFLDQYIERRRAEAEPNMKYERAQEDRFQFESSKFKNLFRPSK
jgi:hypothetical protein